MTGAGNLKELAPVAPEMFVRDVAASVRFYAEELGFDALRVEPDFAVLALGEAVIMLAHEGLYGSALPVARGGGLDIRIMVPDVDEMYRRARDRGVRVVHEIGDRYYGLRDFIIGDPDGFRLRFASPVRLGVPRV